MIRPTTRLFTTLLPVSYATLDDRLTISTRFIRPKQSKGMYIGTEERTPCVWQGRSLRLLESGYQQQSGLISLMHQSYTTEEHVGCQHDWIHIFFVVIDDKANNEDAAASVVAASIQGDAANRMCHVSGDDDWWCNLWDRQGDDNVECTEKHKRAIWLLFYWCTKEKYDCYLIEAWKNNMIVNLNRLTITHLTWYTSMKQKHERWSQRTFRLARLHFGRIRTIVIWRIHWLWGLCIHYKWWDQVHDWWLLQTGWFGLHHTNQATQVAIWYIEVVQWFRPPQYGGRYQLTGWRNC